MDKPIQLTITNVDYRRKDPVFWIEVKTELNQYKHKQKRVPRYYSEIEKLYYHLLTTLDNILIPPIPRCPLPSFDKQTRLLPRQWWLSQLCPSEELGRVEDRLQRWLDRITDNGRVQQSEGLRAFVEAENGFRPVIKHKIKYRHQDSHHPQYTQWTNEFNAYTVHLRSIQQALHRLAFEHSSMADVYLDLSSSLVSYGGIERNAHLFIVYKHMSTKHQQLYTVEKSQAASINETMGSEIRYQLRNTEAAENAVQRTSSVWAGCLLMDKYVDSCHFSAERLKSSVHINRDKVNEAIQTLEEARINKLELDQRYNRIHSQLCEDISSYQTDQQKDMLTSLKEYAKGQLSLEKKKLSLMQDLLQTIK